MPTCRAEEHRSADETHDLPFGVASAIILRESFQGGYHLADL